MWDEIIYPSPNFNDDAVVECIHNFIHTLIGMWLHMHAVG